MEIRTTDTPAQAAGEAISELIAAHPGDTLCLLAGGSALDVVSYLGQLSQHSPEGKAKTWPSGPERPESQDYAAETKKEPDTKKVERRTIFIMGDERGSREPNVNNFLQLTSRYREHWVTERTLPTVPEASESLADFAVRISAQLDLALAELCNPQVIYLMGMGPDGHTAGIFPLPPEQFTDTYERDLSIVPVSLEGLTIDSRVSLTPGWILEHVDHAVGYIAGDSKQTMLESLKTESKPIYERPAELLKRVPHSTVYTNLRP